MEDSLVLEDELRKCLWAKMAPFKPLWMHLLETGIVAQQLITIGCFVPLADELVKYLEIDKEKVVALVGYLSATHDTGKCHPAWEGAVPEAEIRTLLEKYGLFLPWKIRHEQYGAMRLKKIWKEKKRFSSERVINRMAAVIRLHHQGHLQTKATCGRMETDTEAVWAVLQNELEDAMWRIFAPNDIQPKSIDAVCMLLLGIMITADWIASGDTFAFLSTNRSEEQVIADTRRLMKDFLQENHMLHRQASYKIDTFTKLWPDIKPSGMRNLQKTVEKIFADEQKKPLGVILEAPMGCGKTEAGLYAACRLAQRWGKEGFYVALPTAATSNQMYERMNKMLERLQNPQAKLMHGMAWMMDTEAEEQQHFAEKDAELWTAPMRRGLISPFAVGTIDQVMVSVMRAKYGALRLAGLAQKVLIIDELHAYDAYMGTIIESLLKWCRVLHIPVVMLSATLPAEKKESFAGCYEYSEGSIDSQVYPAVTLLYDDQVPSQIPVKKDPTRSDIKIELTLSLGQAEDIAKLVQLKIGNGGCFCVLLNTIREAQEAYLQIRKLMPTVDCVLFHARFSADRRKAIEHRCLEQLSGKKGKMPERLIVVATQVVEQSLDIDFDYMITAICPIDLLLQRMGRLWRHADTKRPKGMDEPQFMVLVPPDADYGATGVVYPEIILQRSQQEISKRKFVHLPEDIPQMVQNVYNDYEIDETTIEQWMAYQMSNDVMQGQAKLQALPDPSEKNFSLAGGDSPVGDLFYSDDESAFLPAKTRLGEISRRIAIVPMDLFGQVQSEEKIHRKTAKAVLGYSVSVPERRIKFLLGKKCKNGMQPMDGYGLLRGTWIVPAEQGSCEFEGGGALKMDEELGLLIEGEEK